MDTNNPTPELTDFDLLIRSTQVEDVTYENDKILVLLEDGTSFTADTAAEAVANLNEAGKAKYSTAIEAALAIVNEAPSSRVLMISVDGGYTVWDTDGGRGITDHVGSAYADEAGGVVVRRFPEGAR